MSSATWMASSRVGTTTRAAGANGRRLACWPRCCSSGMPNASVLPVPVLAWPMMSWPASAMGRASVWMGKAVVMPSAASAAQMGSQTPRSPNVGLPGLSASGPPLMSSGWLSGAADSGTGSACGAGACGDCGVSVCGVSVCAVRAVCFRQRPRCSVLASSTSSQSRAWDSSSPGVARAERSSRWTAHEVLVCTGHHPGCLVEHGTWWPHSPGG
jgi:hypothetical protein